MMEEHRTCEMRRSTSQRTSFPLNHAAASSIVAKWRRQLVHQQDKVNEAVDSILPLGTFRSLAPAVDIVRPTGEGAIGVQGCGSYRILRGRRQRRGTVGAPAYTPHA